MLEEEEKFVNHEPKVAIYSLLSKFSLWRLRVEGGRDG